MIDLERVRPVVDAVLYEGSVLFPYRPSLKNQHRWTFGGLEPPDAGPGTRARWSMQVLVEAGPDAAVELLVRFLQDGEEVRIEAPARPLAALATPRESTLSRGPVTAAATLEAREVATGVFRVTLVVENRSRAAVMESAQGLLAVDGGAWVSPCDPPAGLEAQVAACACDGAWPILLGRPPERTLLFVSPIVLADYPAVAPESPGDLYDATENDELLTLAIRSLTEAERAEIRAGDPRARALVERSLALSAEALGRLHGAVRAKGPPVGTKVRLRPQGRGDSLDLALEGKRARVVAIEQDLEGRRFVAVTVDDDPGRDLGVFGHRYFFRPEEVEPLGPRVLVAGIGNVFFGDDGFAAAVVERLAARAWPAGVEVKDFGIRAVDLGFALERCEAAIVIDAMPRGGAPGTLYVEGDARSGGPTTDPHGLTLDRVLAGLADGSAPRHLRVVGCEPGSLGDPEGELALSPPVQAAVEEAARIVERLVGELMEETARDA